MRSSTSLPFKILAPLVSVAVIATLLITTASPAETSVSATPRTDTITKSLTARPGYGWSRIGTDCNRFGWGCFGGKFYYTNNSNSIKATWHFGDLQGTFKLYKEEHGGTPKNVSGRSRIRVYEKRTGDNSYRLRHEFNLRNNNRDGFWGDGIAIELDGRVKVDLEVISGSVTARRMRLTFVDLLPELREAARELCRAGVVKAMKRWVTIPTALGAASIVVYAAPIVAAKLGGAAGAKLLTPKAARVLALALPGPATADDLVKGEIVGWVLRTVRDFFSGIWRGLSRLYDNAVRDNQYDCRYLRSPLHNLVTRGYGSYANDLAEIYGRRR